MSPHARLGSALAIALSLGPIACATQRVDAPSDVAARDAADESPDASDDAQPDAQPDGARADAQPDDAPRCASGLVDCAGACRDLQTDPTSCGTCGVACAAGQTCAAGACACAAGQALCGATCRALANDPTNCGMCGRACPASQSCAGGECVLMCPAGQTNCEGACRTLPSDPQNCGVCGRACPAGHTCAANICLPGAPGGPPFQLNWLGTTNCRSIEHAAITGADRGGIAIANTQFFVTGQVATGRFGVASLEGAPVGRRFDALAGNLRTGVVYTFADASGPLAAPGGTALALVELDGATGALTTRTVTLSSPIPLMGEATGSTVGIFSGWDRILVMAGGRAYNIDLPDGAVLDLGASPLPTRSECPGWAFWGVAEFNSGIPYIVYVADTQTVARRPLPMGPVAPVSRFSSLSTMCSFAVAAGAQRWYFHHAGPSQLAGSAGAAETAGFCDASSSVAGTTCPPDAINCGGVCRLVRTDAANCGACGRVCPAGEICAAAACGAPPTRYVRSVPPPSVTIVDSCRASGHATLLMSVDDASQSTTLPFDFRYWGATLRMGTPVSVSSNGFMVMNTAAPFTDRTGVIPSAAAPNGVIAPYWANLRTSIAGVCVATVGNSPDRHFAVLWSNATNSTARPTDNITFEAVLNESDQSIDLFYGTMTGAPAGVAGIENAAGSDFFTACPAGMGVDTSCTVPANHRVRFAPAP